MTLELYRSTIEEITVKNGGPRKKEITTGGIVEITKTFKLGLNANIFIEFADYTKAELQVFCKEMDIVKVIAEHSEFLNEAYPKMPFDELSTKAVYTLTKLDLCIMIYTVFSQPKLKDAILSKFKGEYMELWNALVWSSELSARQVKEIVGISPIVSNGVKNDYYKTEIIITLPQFNFAAHEDHYYEDTSKWIFSINKVVRLLLKPTTPAPKGQQMIPIDLPAGINIFESEDLALMDIGKVYAYYSQENIKTTTLGRPTAATITKMAKSLSLVEYYNNEQEGLSHLRTHIWAGLIVKMPIKTMSIGTAAVNLLKDIYNQYQKNRINALGIVMAHFEEYSKFERSTNPSIINHYIVDAIKDLRPAVWYAADNLEKHLFYNNIPYVPLSRDNARFYFSFPIPPSASYRFSRQVSIKGDHYAPVIAQNYLKGSLFILSAMGIIDIAYDTPNMAAWGNTYMSKFEGLTAFRITPLGAFLLGQTDKYVATVEEDNTELFFDENELIILGKADDKLTDTLLTNYTQKAGANRYIVTPQSFLKDCKTSRQISDKVKLFKKAINQNTLPDNWEAFLKDLVKQAESVQKISNYQVYQLNAEDKNLIRLIAQEQSFKDIVLKSEGLKVLVLDKHVNVFRTKLKEWGYLLE